MGIFIVVAFVVICLAVGAWAITQLPTHVQKSTQPKTLARPAQGRDAICPHTRYEPVDVNGIVVANLCLNPACGAQLGPVVSRDPDGYVYFSEYD